MGRARLPVELWDLVVCTASRTEQRTCLFVSKLFHDLALPSVFGHLTLHYGIPLPEDGFYSLPSGERRQKYDIQFRRNQEILNHIASVPLFAQAIRELVVCWYELYLAHDEHIDDPRSKLSVPLRRSRYLQISYTILDGIEGALSHLHNLRSLSWCGEAYKITPGIVCTIASACTRLRSLRIP